MLAILRELPALTPSLVRGAVADLRHRYAGAWLGASWNLWAPLAQLAVYAVVFGALFPSDDPVLFTLRLCAGVVTWIVLAETVQTCAVSFVESAVYLRKLPVPEIQWPLQAGLSGALRLGIAWCLLVVAALVLGVPPHASWLAVLGVLLLLQTLAAAVGLFVGTVHVFFRDAAQVVAVLLQVVFWLTPIVYPRTLLDSAPALAAVVDANPLTTFFTALQDAFVDGVWPGALAWAVMLAVTALVSVGALAAFAHFRPQIRDVL